MTLFTLFSCLQSLPGLLSLQNICHKDRATRRLTLSTGHTHSWHIIYIILEKLRAVPGIGIFVVLRHSQTLAKVIMFNLICSRIHVTIFGWTRRIYVYGIITILIIYILILNYASFTATRAYLRQYSDLTIVSSTLLRPLARHFELGEYGV